MTRGRIIVFIICVILGGLLLWGLFARAAASETLPAVAGTLSPTPLPTATAQPCASTATVHWASGWRRSAIRSWKKWNRARQCFGLRMVPFNTLSARAPGRGEPKSVWMDAGRGWKHDRGVYNSRFAGLWHHMNYPGGSGWERWRPLVRWVWPAPLVNTVIEIMHWESHGQEFVWNGGGSGAYGLLQLLPKPSGVYRAYSQIVYGYYHKYLPAGGWSPWAGCHAFD